MGRKDRAATRSEAAAAAPRAAQVPATARAPIVSLEVRSDSTVAFARPARRPRRAHPAVRRAGLRLRGQPPQLPAAPAPGAAAGAEAGGRAGLLRDERGS